ncbi:LOW QUALITY PROTEIN: hypothetical protein HID58_047238, partial [Brassica napus]
LQPIQQTPDGTSHGSQIDLYEIPYPASGVYCRIKDCPSRTTSRNTSDQNLGITQRCTLERIEENIRRADNRKQARFTPYEDSRNHRRTDHSQGNQGYYNERPENRNHHYDESTYLTDHSRTDHSLQKKTEKETEQDPDSLLIDYHPLERTRISLSDPVECAQQITQLRMFGALSQEIGRMVDTLTRSNLKCLTHHLPSHHVSGLLHLISRHRARPDPLVKSLQLHLQDAQLSSDCLMETLMPQREKDAQQSGRLQEVDIQYLEEMFPYQTPEAPSIPSSSRLPPSGERVNDGMLERSPIHTLSEDRAHVSLRLGPLPPSVSPPSTRMTLRGTGKKKIAKTPAKKRTIRSPVQGISLNKR